MKYFIGLSIALFLCLFTRAQSPSEQLNQLFDARSRKVLVAAHRGDWRNAPENSLQGLLNCIAKGVDIVELDLKRTKDGQLIVMHDPTIDRTTNGKGKPGDYTLAEIRKFRLRNGLGRVSGHPVPTFEEMLLVARGKILIDVDKGYDYFPDVVRLLKETGTLNQAIANIDDDTSLDSVEARYGQLDDRLTVMPIINYGRPGAAGIVSGYKKHRRTIFQPVFDTDTLLLLDSLPALRAAGFGIWLNSMWPKLSGGHDDDKAVEQGQSAATWGWLVNKSASVIQTDRPVELKAFLR